MCNDGFIEPNLDTPHDFLDLKKPRFLPIKFLEPVFAGKMFLYKLEKSFPEVLESVLQAPEEFLFFIWLTFLLSSNKAGGYFIPLISLILP